MELRSGTRKAFRGLNLDDASLKYILPRQFDSTRSCCDACAANAALQPFLLWHTQKRHAASTVLLIYLVSGILALTHGFLTHGTHVSEGDSLLWKVFRAKFSLKRQSVHVILESVECKLTRAAISVWFVHGCVLGAPNDVWHIVVNECVPN